MTLWKTADAALKLRGKTAETEDRLADGRTKWFIEKAALFNPNCIGGGGGRSHYATHNLEEVPVFT